MAVSGTTRWHSPELGRVRHVIVNPDGVLRDTSRLRREAVKPAQDALKPLQDSLRGYKGTVHEFGGALDDLYLQSEVLYAHLLDTGAVTFFGGIPEAFSNLRAQNISISIYSPAFRSTVEREFSELERSSGVELRKKVAVVVSRDDTTSSGISTVGIRMVVRRLDEDFPRTIPTQVVFVGADKETITAAKEAGVISVRINDKLRTGGVVQSHLTARARMPTLSPTPDYESKSFLEFSKGLIEARK